MKKCLTIVLLTALLTSISSSAFSKQYFGILFGTGSGSKITASESYTYSNCWPVGEMTTTYTHFVF